MTNQNIDLDLKRWSNRGKEGSEIYNTISDIVARTASDRGYLSDGDSATDILVKDFLDHPDITNQQLIAARGLTIDDFSQPDPESIIDKFPNYQDLPIHQQAVDLLHALTGIDKGEISKKLPGLGITGTPGKLVTLPENEKLRRGTILHDILSYLDDAIKIKKIRNAENGVIDPRFENVESFNKSIFGIENIATSAVWMAAKAFYSSTTDVIPNENEILKFLGQNELETLGQDLPLRQTVTKLGEAGSSLGTKLAFFYANKDIASQLIGQAAGKTIGGYLGDAINYQAVGIPLPVEALYRRLSGNLATTATNLTSSAISQSLQEALDIDDPLGQVGIDVVSQTFTELVFSKLAVGAFGGQAYQYLGLDPKVNLNFNFDSVTGEIFKNGFTSLQNFVGSQLFTYLDEAWEGANLKNKGAVFGGIIGGFIAPGIGNFLGKVIGGWIWDVIDGEPRAYYVVKFNPKTGAFTNEFSFEGDGGRLEVAQQMSKSASEAITLIAGMIGGTPTQIQDYEYGHFEKDFIYQPLNGERFSSSNVEEVIRLGIVTQLRTLRVEGGDPYMKWVIALPTYNPDSLQQLFEDVGVAQEYSIHKKADPVLYGQMILNVQDDKARQYLLEDWRRIQAKANQLALKQVPGNDGGEFLAGTPKNDELDGSTGNDFVFGDAGDDLLEGGSGNDRIEGAEGSDTISGGDGDDILIPDKLGGEIYRNTVDGGAGTDLLTLDYSNYRFFIGGTETKTGIFNTREGEVKNFWHGNIDAGILLTYSNIERFDITGTLYDDHLKAKAGDHLNGYDGIDRLDLDLANVASTVTVDLTLSEAQVNYNGTSARNFEIIGQVTTGTGNDSIKLSSPASSNQGTVNGGAGTDLLTLDYSNYRFFIGGTETKTGIFNTREGEVKNFWHGNIDAGILLTYSNIERFDITGTLYDDHLKAKAGDHLNGYDGIDRLDLDLANSVSPVIVDLSRTEDQVLYHSTEVRNFEIIGQIITGVGDDRIKLNSAASSSQGTVNGGKGIDRLILDYSDYKLLIGGSNTRTGVFNTANGQVKNFWYANIDAGLILTYSNFEQFDIIGTAYNDELYGADLEDTLTGGGGADILRAGLGSDTYQLNPQTAGGSQIQDSGGVDTLLLNNRTLSLTAPTVGVSGLQRQDTTLFIDLNQDGAIDEKNDLRILDFFTASGTTGAGFIENVGGLTGNEILNALGMAVSTPRRIDFEGVEPTFKPPLQDRAGVLKELRVAEGLITRGTTPFDVIINIDGFAKPPEFGQHTLDPFFNQQDLTPFTLEISASSPPTRTVSIAMGDYGSDTDTLTLQAFDDQGALIAEEKSTLPASGSSFTWKTLSVISPSSPIRSIKFIGGSEEFPHSVFYDNIRLSGFET